MGLFAPEGLRREIVARLHGEVGRLLAAPETRAQIAATGVEVSLSPPEEFAAFVRSEYEKCGKVVRDTVPILDIAIDGRRLVHGFVSSAIGHRLSNDNPVYPLA